MRGKLCALCLGELLTLRLSVDGNASNSDCVGENMLPAWFRELLLKSRILVGRRDSGSWIAWEEVESF